MKGGEFCVREGKQARSDKARFYQRCRARSRRDSIDRARFKGSKGGVFCWCRTKLRYLTQTCSPLSPLLFPFPYPKTFLDPPHKGFADHGYAFVHSGRRSRANFSKNSLLWHRWVICQTYPERKYRFARAIFQFQTRLFLPLKI